MRRPRVLTRHGAPIPRAMNWMLVGILLTPQVVVPATIVVDGTDSSIVAADGICSLREAIHNANSDSDTSGGDCAAGVGADTLTLTADVTLTEVDNATNGDRGLPSISTEINVTGGFTISRDAAAPEFGIFAVDPTGALSLDRTTVSGGELLAGQGAGIFVSGGQITLTESTVSDNIASSWGAGIATDDEATLLVVDSTISDNFAGSIGGGLHIDYMTDATLVNTTISGNSAGYKAGGIYTYWSVTQLIGSTVSENFAGRAAGGIYSSVVDELTVINSTISGNIAEAGGGIVNLSSKIWFINSTISGNIGTEIGGAMLFDEGWISLTNTTVTGNFSKVVGGIFGSWYQYVTVSLESSIVAGNASGDCGGPGKLVDLGGNFSGDGSCPGAPIVAGEDFDSALASHGGATETHALLPGSPAIDAAGDCELETDQRGVARDDGACDSGSFEIGAAHFGLYVGGKCPGSVVISAFAPALAGEMVKLYAGRGPGTTEVPDGPCAGTELDLSSARPWVRLALDETGQGSVIRTLPSGWCTRHLQALSRNCSTSDSVPIVRLPLAGHLP